MTTGAAAAARVRTAALTESDGRWAVLLCLLLALVLRLAALVTVSHPEMLRGEFSLNSDEPSFHDTAVALATTGEYRRTPGGPLTAFRPPAAVLPLAAIFRLVRPAPQLAVAWTMLCGLGIVVVMYRLGCALGGDRVTGVVAALVGAAMPTLVFTASGIWSEPQAILLALLALWLLVREPGRDLGTAGWATVGACLSLAYLTRQSFGLLLPVVAVGALRSPRRVVHVAALVLAFALPVGAWTARNCGAMGECIAGATVSGEALWGSNNPVTAGLQPPALAMRDGFDLAEEARSGCYLGSWVPMEYTPGWIAGGSELETYHQQLDSTRAFLMTHPEGVLPLLGHKLVRLVTLEPYAPSISGDVGLRRLLHRIATLLEYWFMLGFGGLGLWRTWRARRGVAWWYAGFFVAGVASVVATYPNPRLMLPATVILVPMAALAVTRVLLSRVADPRRFARAALALGLFLAVTGGVGVLTARRLNVPGDLHAPGTGLQDFRDAIYYPAVALRDGANPYDADRFVRTYPVRIAFPLYPPAAIVVHLPFGLLPFERAEWAYFLWTAALTPLLAWLALRLADVRISGETVFGFSALLLLTRPGYWNLFLGQYAVSMAVGVYAALYFRDRPWAAGGGVAIGTLKPTYGGPLAVLMLARGEWRPIVRGMLVGGLLSLAAVPVLVQSAGGVGPLLASLGGSGAAFQADPEVNPATSSYRIDAAAFFGHLLGIPLGLVGNLAIAALVLGAAVLVVRRLAADTQASSRRLSDGLVCVAILASTYHQTYDLLLLALPIVVVATTPRRHNDGLRWLLLAALLVPVLNHLVSASLLTGLPAGSTLWVVVTALNSAVLLLALVLYLALAPRWLG